jgi:hypothetical protein
MSTQSRSATAFLLGVGAGSASFISHLSGWTLNSISGFSTAFARVLEVRPFISRISTKQSCCFFMKYA